MVSARSNIIAGVIFAVVATLAWALNFIAPYVTGAYSIYDLLLVRFLFAGALGGIGAIVCRAQRRLLHRAQPWQAAGLGVIGYLAYSGCIAAGVMLAGPVLTAACVGFVPVLLALLGNAREKTVQWRALFLPLMCMVAGLVLSTVSSMGLPDSSRASWFAGMLASVAAVMLWIIFSLLNQRAMERLHPDATVVWTGLMMAGAGLGAVCLIPVGHALGLFNLPNAGFGFAVAGPLYAWAVGIALMSSLIGAWAWNAATRRLPMMLSGQLISLESLFAAVLGLIYSGRFPAVMEALGLAAVLIGAALAVRGLLGVTKSAEKDRFTR